MFLHRLVLPLGALLAFALPYLAAQDKKAPDKDKKAASAAALVRLGEVVATLTEVQASSKQLTVQYNQKVVGKDLQLQDMPVTVEVQTADDVKVRILQLPPAFDDKGKPRRYTPKELKQLKGPDPKQPGYTGGFDSLKPGQKVQLTLARSKDALKKPPKGKPRDDQEALENVTVTRVVILAEPQ